MRKAVRLAILTGLVLGSLVSCLPTMRNYEGHKVFNPFYLFYLESSWRDGWQKPEEVVKALRLSPGDVIADIGAGGGYFTEKFSRSVGDAGRVYATDVQKIMIRKLHDRVKNRSLRNVTVVVGAFDDPRLPDQSCDIAFFSSVYKEIEDREAYMRKLGRGLKPGGRVAIIEYRLDAPEPGPEVGARLPEERVIQEMDAAGYTLAERFDFLPREYFLVFVLKENRPRPRDGKPAA